MDTLMIYFLILSFWIPKEKTKRENQNEETRNQKKIRQGERKKKTCNIKQRKKDTAKKAEKA